MKTNEFFISAPNQVYTKAFLKKIKEEHLVVYDGKSCYAVRIIPRKNMNPLFEILGEDDGNLFSCNHNITFDMYFTDGLIKQLKNAKNYWEEIKDKYN